MANIKWTQEQKLKALALAEATSVYAAADQLGIPVGSIKRWRKELREEGGPPLPNEPLKRTKRTEPNEVASEPSNEPNQTNRPKRTTLSRRKQNTPNNIVIGAHAIREVAQEAVQEAKENVRDYVEDRVKQTAEYILHMTELAAREAVKVISEGPKDEETKAQWLRSVIGAIAQGAEKYQLLTGKPTSRQHVEGEMKTSHEQHYHITQEIVSAHPELVDVIFGRGVEDRGGEG